MKKIKIAYFITMGLNVFMLKISIIISYYVSNYGRVYKQEVLPDNVDEIISRNYEIHYILIDVINILFNILSALAVILIFYWIAKIFVVIYSKIRKNQLSIKNSFYCSLTAMLAFAIVFSIQTALNYSKSDRYFAIAEKVVLGSFNNEENKFKKITSDKNYFNINEWESDGKYKSVCIKKVCFKNWFESSSVICEVEFKDKDNELYCKKIRLKMCEDGKNVIINNAYNIIRKPDIT